MMSQVFVRIYTFPADAKKANAFCVGDEIGGLTERLATFIVQESTTWGDLRSMIEFEQVDGMYKRTTLNLELRYIMRKACNPHGYSFCDLLSYDFATVEAGPWKSDSKKLLIDAVPNLLSPKLETELVGGQLLGLDLVLVPKTQIRPQDSKIASEKWSQKVP
jgi:hypothetical protein